MKLNIGKGNLRFPFEPSLKINIGKPTVSPIMELVVFSFAEYDKFS